MLPAAGAGSPDFADLLYAPQSTVPGRIEGTRPIGLPLSFGLGCARYCADMHGFDGGFRGQSSCIRFDRQRGLGIAIGVNVGSATVRSRVFEAIMQSIGFGADARSPNIRRSYDFDLARLPGTYRGVDRSSLIVSETPAGFDLDFQLAGYGTRFQASVGYDRKQNLPRVSGSAQLCGLAIFSEPNHQTPCVGVGVTAFRQQDRAAHA
jgi:hypothetical protein